MNHLRSLFFTGAYLMFCLVLGTVDGQAQNSSKDKKLIIDCTDAKAQFIRTDKLMENLFDNAYAYVIFPNVGKGGLIAGGAMGNGIVYRKNKPVGKAKLTQVTLGFQAGGEAYREVIFFENETVFSNFKQDKIEFTAGVSAVVATEGAAAKQKYTEGVMVFQQVKAGLMIEASAGGQKFKYSDF